MKRLSFLSLALGLGAVGQIIVFYYWPEFYLSLEGPFLVFNQATSEYATSVRTITEIPLTAGLTVVWGLIAIIHIYLFAFPKRLEKLLKNNWWTWINLALPTSLLGLLVLWLFGVTDPALLTLVFISGCFSSFIGWRGRGESWCLAPIIAGLPVWVVASYWLWYWLYGGSGLSGYILAAFCLFFAYYALWLAVVWLKPKPKMTAKYIGIEMVGEFIFKAGVTWLILAAVL